MRIFQLLEQSRRNGESIAAAEFLDLTDAPE